MWPGSLLPAFGRREIVTYLLSLELHMKHLLLIALGGGLGALMRYSISKFVMQASNTFFPIGTLAVNIMGCFFIGFFFDIFSKSVLHPDLKSLITIGFLGAFTTFSTFSLETVNLFISGELKYGLYNILISNTLGIIFVIAGIYSSRLLLMALK